jgi:hypothetical protein
MDIFTSSQLQSLMVVAVITTIVVSAINVIQTKSDGTNTIAGKWLTAIVAILVTLLQTTFSRGMSFEQWQQVLTNILLTTALAILFWTFLGQFTVDHFFGWLKKKIAEKYGNGGTPQS